MRLRLAAAATAAAAVAAAAAATTAAIQHEKHWKKYGQAPFFLSGRDTSAWYGYCYGYFSQKQKAQLRPRRFAVDRVNKKLSILTQEKEFQLNTFEQKA